ncbi:M56 family metallopeptidase [Candidatus Latescibacterota bacterium]
MRELLFIEWILHFSSQVIVIGLGLLVQSTIIIAPCLFAVYALRNKGSAVQSLVLRAALAAVLLCPAISLYFHYSGVNIFKVPIPSVSYELPEKARSSSAADRDGTPAVKANEPETYAGTDDLKSRPQLSNEVVFFDSRGEKIPVPERFPNVAAPAPENRTQAPSSNIRIFSYLFFTFSWIAFSVFLIVRIFLHSIYIKYIQKKAFFAKPGHAAICRELADKLGIKKPVVLQSSHIKSPFLSGIIKPTILMPKCEDDLSLPIKEILLHELSHLQRYDCLWNLLRQMGTIAVPFQPLMWILSHWIEETSDYACDDFVMKYTGNNRSYARVLLNIARSFHQSGCEATAGVGFLSFKSPLRRRIGRILNSTHILSLRTNARLVLSISFLCFSASIASGFVGFESENILNRRKGTLNIVSSMILNSIIDPFPENTLSPISLPQNDGAPLSDSKENNTDIDTAESPDLIKIVDSGTSELHISHAEESEFTAVDDAEPAERAVGGDIRSHGLFGAGAEAMSGEQSLFTALNNNELLSGRLESGRRTENTIAAVSEEFPVTMTEQGNEPPGQAQMGSSQNFGASTGSSFAGGGGMRISGFKGDVIKMPVAKAVNVTVDVDYENQMYDLQNEEDKRQYSIYHGLDKLKNEPAWSPDGKWIAFTDRSRIWVVSPNGGEPTLVYESFQDGFSVGNFECLSFTPNSKEITFKKDLYDTSRGSIIVILKSEGGRTATFSNPIPNIECVNIETGESRVLIEEGYNFCLSPGGRYICFLSWASRLDPDGAKNGGHGLPALYDTETGEIRFLADDDRRYGKPSFGPDERHVIIPVREENGPIELHRLYIDGSGSEQLTFYDENDGYGKYLNFPEISPDGQWVLYTDYTRSEGKPGSRLFLYSTVTGERFEYFENAETRNSYGKWSPDGAKICYLVQEKGSNYIYICDFFPENYVLMKPALTEADVPLSFALNQNFPNPFNSSTTIEYSVPDAGHVSLTIYNVIGQKVADLVSAGTEPGIHSVVWDGRDNNGMIVSTGVYISCLQMGNKREIRKMTLFK